MVQSEFVQSAQKTEAVLNSGNQDLQIPSSAHTSPSLSEGRATTTTRESGCVFRDGQCQAGLTGQLPAKFLIEGPGFIKNGTRVSTAIDQSAKKNKHIKFTADILPMPNYTAGEPREDPPEPLIAFVPVRLAAPRVEIEASNWLVYGDEDGEREDPVPFLWPSEKHWLSGYNFSSYHPGIDIAAYTGDLIYSAASGKVISVNYSNRGYGNMIIIDHLNGYQTLYAHLSTILTEMGSYVIQGQPIGLAGSTGYSTGAHLHFEIHDQGRYVNPWLFLKQ